MSDEITSPEEVQPLCEPCPFCLTDRKPEVNADLGGDDPLAYIICLDCGASSPTCYSVAEAVDKWNRTSRLVRRGLRASNEE